MSLPALVLAALVAQTAPPAEAWTCKITADMNKEVVMLEGRFAVMGQQLFVPPSDAVPLGWRMRIIRNNAKQLLAASEDGPDRQWLIIDKKRLSITTYSFANRWSHNGTCRV